LPVAWEPHRFYGPFTRDFQQKPAEPETEPEKTKAKLETREIHVAVAQHFAVSFDMHPRLANYS